jgi:hypothetical protein
MPTGAAPSFTASRSGLDHANVAQFTRRTKEDSMDTHVLPLSPRQRHLVLGVIALALMMVVSAVSGLNVALPDLARDTGASQSELQWIVDA